MLGSFDKFLSTFRECFSICYDIFPSLLLLGLSHCSIHFERHRVRNCRTVSNSDTDLAVLNFIKLLLLYKKCKDVLH